VHKECTQSTRSDCVLFSKNHILKLSLRKKNTHIIPCYIMVNHCPKIGKLTLLKLKNSCSVSSNIKSLGKRSIFLCYRFLFSSFSCNIYTLPLPFPIIVSTCSARKYCKSFFKVLNLISGNCFAKSLTFTG